MKKWMWAALWLLVPAGAAGQIGWDSPMLLPPNPPNGLGLYLVDVYRGELGVLGTWRSPSRSLGLRAGIADGPGGNLGVLGGFDLVGDLTRSTEEFPLDIDWVFGGGIGIADGALITIPLGLSLGHAFESEGVGFVPYLTPRVMLDACIDCGRYRPSNDDVRLNFTVDLGLDLKVSSSLLVRFGASLGDRDGVAIGLGF